MLPITLVSSMSQSLVARMCHVRYEDNSDMIVMLTEVWFSLVSFRRAHWTKVQLTMKQVHWKSRCMLADGQIAPTSSLQRGLIHMLHAEYHRNSSLAWLVLR